MNLKPILINTALALVLSGCFAQAESIEDQPQVNITAQKYEVLKRTCHETCFATVKADDYSIYVEYALDDASVEFLDILNVVHFDKTINAYVDRYEIEKINAAIAKGER
jgi:PBP1b-binding outer membrane lipoprotein LpoB